MKTIITFLLLSIILVSQTTNLYIPQPIKKAYQKETRSYNGAPGKNYWLNEINYIIKAEVDPFTKILDGQLSVRYVNNSPDTLKEIVMHLYPDLFKSGTVRDWPIPKEAVNDGVLIKKLSVDYKDYDVSDTSRSISRSTTNMKIKLDEPLNPKDELLIETEWSFPIPELRPVRTGAYSDTSMFIAYWYPKIAVYDDIHGWDEITYTGTAEMYSSVASFSVEITVPQNYIVWATGVFENPDEILTDNVLERYNKAQESEEIINIIKAEDIHSDVTKREFSAWKFKANKAPDFAFALGKNYLWDGAIVKLKDKTVFVDAGYLKESVNFKEVVRISTEAIKFHSFEMPGVIFPYPTFSVFNGRGGMEFPMIVNDGEARTYESTVGLTTHELAHTYFPFYMGINERRYAFLDEGWAVFSPTRIQRRLGEYNPIEGRFKVQERQLETILEVPPMTPSFLLKGTHYRVASYSRSAGALFALEELLGEELFLNAIQTFISEWKEKHPTPYDFFFTFDRVAKENLSWFWKPWFFEFHSPELNLVEYINEGGRKYVTVSNDGGLPLPIKLKIYFADNSEENISVSPRVWKNGEKKVEVNLNTNKEILEIELGDELVPDINYSQRKILKGDN